MGEAGREVLRFDGVSKTFGVGAAAVHALRDLSFTVVEGELVALMGPSGSGKSTALNILGLLDRPTSGAYFLGSRPAGALPERERTALRAASLGFVFQAFHLLPHLTAYENVCLAAAYAAVPRRERRDRAMRALSRVGLAAREKSLPGVLSGGERQRVAIARAIVTSPQILLCDEPTGNLDSENASTVLGLIRELSEAGQATVIVTHDVAVGESCDRVLHLRDGSLVQTSYGDSWISRA